MIAMRTSLSSLFAAVFLGISAWCPIALAASVDERSIVLSYVGNDLFAGFLSYPDVVDEYEDSESGAIGDLLLERSGAASVGLQRAGTEDDRAAIAALLGRLFLYHGERAEARTRLEAALEAAATLGWDDRRANGILRDLAWLLEASSDSSAPDYARRASLCPLPCTEDAITRLFEAGTVAEQQVYSALGKDLGHVRITEALGEDMVAFAELTYGPASPEVVDAWRTRAISARGDRPWQALGYYQQALDLLQGGLNEPDVLNIRRSVATLLLETGEYARLAEYSQALLADALEAVKANPEVQYLPDIAMTAARLHARALWHMRAPEARAAYAVAIETMFQFRDADMAGLLLQDLIDAGYDTETLAIADAFLRASPGDADASFAKARVAARAGNYEEAAAIVAEIATPSPIAVLQRAAYLELAGKPDDAAALRAGVTVFEENDLAGWGPWSKLSELIEARDAGAHEGAAEAALSYLEFAERMIAAGNYLDAQRLWQIAYTLARGGETKVSFRLMKEAASIAARLSFAAANDTDGGSLQLMRRDKFRYLLFVDIAWAAATGGSPHSMTVSSRY